MKYFKVFETTTDQQSYLSGDIITPSVSITRNIESTIHYVSEIIVNTNNYLTIEAKENGLTVILSVNACEYCIDGDGEWKTLAAGTPTEPINIGHKLSFRGNLTPTSSAGIGTFTISKKCNLKGNCMSMLFGDDAVNSYSLSGKTYAFYKLFNSCTTIVNVSENFLPATTLTNCCYQYMFNGCTSLIKAPKLPATSLFVSCYQYMFSGCTSLTTAPTLPATTLVRYCYSKMFNGCTALINPPIILGTSMSWATYCCEYMFAGCTSLKIAPILSATTLEENCYYSMFSDCTSLTTAPVLPATTLASSCYNSMFSGCISLTNAPALPATTLAASCYVNMFSGCISLTNAPALPATTLMRYCYSNMFYGCTSLTTAPELPAAILTTNCYEYMFYGCSKLNNIKMLATDISASSCLMSWVYGVSSTGTFTKNSVMKNLTTGQSGIPSGWTVVNDGEESGGNLITFTIDGTEYQAEEGMTWVEWCNSDYNVNNYEYDEWGIYWNNGGSSTLVLFNSTDAVVDISDIILPTGTYIFSD
jgi:hypothetical protein